MKKKKVPAQKHVRQILWRWTVAKLLSIISINYKYNYTALHGSNFVWKVKTHFIKSNWNNQENIINSFIEEKIFLK